MNKNVPFPSRGGDWRYDVRTGQLVDASKVPATPEPTPAAQPTEPKPARGAKRAK